MTSTTLGYFEIWCYQTYERTCVYLKCMVHGLATINLLTIPRYEVDHFKWKYRLVISSLFLACGYNKEQNCFCYFFLFSRIFYFIFLYGSTCYLPFLFYSRCLLSTSLLKYEDCTNEQKVLSEKRSSHGTGKRKGW